mmetsp:Transcript_50569/g.99489  ORF Transcript_50569/g.99489 Transcript_50569/m.99489 type:complete len:123 (+) Transcript_50569:80-448(+)
MLFLFDQESDRCKQKDLCCFLRCAEGPHKGSSCHHQNNSASLFLHLRMMKILPHVWWLMNLIRLIVCVVSLMQEERKEGRKEGNTPSASIDRLRSNGRCTYSQSHTDVHGCVYARTHRKTKE